MVKSLLIDERRRADSEQQVIGASVEWKVATRNGCAGCLRQRLLHEATMRVAMAIQTVTTTSTAARLRSTQHDPEANKLENRRAAQAEKRRSAFQKGQESSGM